MVDIHCHILHRFDDGSASLEESLAMARMAADSGVTDIVATPHFPGEAASLRRVSRLMERYQTLSEAIRQDGIPLTLHPGAEILCTGETPRLARQALLPTIGQSRYCLTEFFFDEDFDFMHNTLRAIAEAGYRPVVAHPERYRAIQQQPLVLDRWFRRGYILQLNKGSVLGAFGPRVQRTAADILEAGLAHVIASDAHTATRRTPHMGPLLRWLEHHLDEEYARILVRENPLRILRDQAVVPAGSSSDSTRSKL